MPTSLPDQLSTDEVIAVIKYLLGVIGSLLGVGGAMWVYAHKSMLKKLDKIDEHLQPMLTKLEVHDVKIDNHTERIKSLEETTKQHTQEINHYDGRIQNVERIVKTIVKA